MSMLENKCNNKRKVTNNGTDMGTNIEKHLEKSRTEKVCENAAGMVYSPR